MSDFLAVGRLRPDGANDESYGPQGLAIHATEFIAADEARVFSATTVFWLDRRGRILVGFQDSDGGPDPDRVYRVNGDGTLDRGFGQDGWIAVPSGPRGIWTDASDRIHVLFHATQGSTALRFLESGAADPGYGLTGQAELDGWAIGVNRAAMTVTREGIAYIAVRDRDRVARIERLNPDGQRDRDFAARAAEAIDFAVPDQRGQPSAYINALALDADRGILACGLAYVESASGERKVAILALSSQSGARMRSHGWLGLLEMRFLKDPRIAGPVGSSTRLFASGLEFDSEGRLVFTLRGSGAESFVGRIERTGRELDQGFAGGLRALRPPTGYSLYASALALSPTDDPIVGVNLGHMLVGPAALPVPPYMVLKYRAADGLRDTSFNGTGLRVLDQGLSSQRPQFPGLVVDERGRIQYLIWFQTARGNLGLRLRVTLMSIAYEGDDIGQEWELSFTVNNRSILLQRRLVHGRWDGTQEVLFDEPIDMAQYRRTGRWMATASIWPFELDLPWDRDVGTLVHINQDLRSAGEAVSRTVAIPVSERVWIFGETNATALLRITLRFELVEAALP